MATAHPNDLGRLQHELRTPLNAVLGFAMLIRRQAASQMPAQALAWLAQIENAAQLMLSLIERMACGVEDDPHLHTRSDLRRSVIDAVQMLSFAALHAGVDLVLEADEGTPLLAPGGETTQRQVLLNVVGNAIKYTRAGGRVTVGLRTGRCGPAHALVTVRDNGIGIGAEQCKRLFQPYQRLGRECDSTTGTGLGLYLTKRMLESIGGRLELCSREGEGTLVTLYLPLSEAAVASASGRP